MDMPNFGNSHDWTKTQTATISSKINKSFMLSILSRVSGGTRRLIQVAIDHGDKLMLGQQADLRFPHVSVFDQQQRRNAPHAVL